MSLQASVGVRPRIIFYQSNLSFYTKTDVSAASSTSVAAHAKSEPEPLEHVVNKRCLVDKNVVLRPVASRRVCEGTAEFGRADPNRGRSPRTVGVVVR